MSLENLILAIESTGDNCGVAIGNTDEIFLEISLNIKHSHDKKLATIIKKSLELLEIEVTNLSAVAISSGPGSFTGLRVGSALAKALTYNDQPKLISVPTLASLAYNAKEYINSIKKKGIISIIPSNRDNYFIQMFDENSTTLTSPEIVSKEDFKKKYNLDYLLCGPGAIDFLEETDLLYELTILTPKNILKFAQNEYVNERFVKSEEFSPRYYQEFKPTQKKSK